MSDQATVSDKTTTPSTDPVCGHPGCGRPVVTTGRAGRPPKYCDEHRTPTSRRSSSTTSAARPTSTNVKRAVDNLDQLYAMLGTAMFMLGAPGAASTLAAERDSLRASNAEFLANDPQLVAMLNKGAAATGRAGFIVSNAMVLAPVVTLAVQEVTARRRPAGGESTP